jgi:hypothetical protein
VLSRLLGRAWEAMSPERREQLRAEFSPSHHHWAKTFDHSMADLIKRLGND